MLIVFASSFPGAVHFKGLTEELNLIAKYVYNLQVRYRAIVVFES